MTLIIVRTRNSRSKFQSPRTKKKPFKLHCENLGRRAMTSFTLQLLKLPQYWEISLIYILTVDPDLFYVHKCPDSLVVSNAAIYQAFHLK